MTITARDRREVSEAVSPFSVQNALYDDTPNVIKNMLRELAERPVVPDGVELSERVIRDICDQKELGSTRLRIDNRLSAELSQHSFEAEYTTGLDIDDLKQKVEKPQYSYPAVELSLEIYEPTGYEIQLDSNGRARSLSVLVMCINHDSVLMYDPLKYADTDISGSLEATEVDKKEFVKGWKGRLETTSALWVEETDQQRLSQY
ncbi:hypothetical protein SAMN04488065_2804 [Haloplanus vescus]|uniref:Uncharacterized protein n=1 Tax=Haloplanus vescus TaxID=555874 RepID=A0A1H4AIL4_9EURY|nr:hypothetical protein [Haloplanus vescus]SEA35745.1 hypothetical protein SAMN04488065_2804 [Haloplanus vescus]